jgi:hypothetical protein
MAHPDNKMQSGFGPWPQWFADIALKHGASAYGGALPSGKRGDVIVGWRRGTDNFFEWSKGAAQSGRMHSMLVLGSKRPTDAELSEGDIGVTTGVVNSIWLSYLVKHKWKVIPEGSRGRNQRPWGQLWPE